jgi:hypothetical protein
MIGIAACTETSNLTAPAPKASAPSAQNDLVFTCNASIAARTVNCGDMSTGLLRGDIVIGGQGTYVTLHSSNITVNADTIAFDVSVQNMIWQPIGTSDTSNVADPAGIRPFFISGPTSTGAGTITVANADGFATFTASNQSYFKYAAVAQQGQTTPNKRWKLQFSPEVQNFTFQVAVSAPVKWPNGYVRDLPRVVVMNPYELYELSGTVRNKFDQIESGSITFTSADPAFAPISGPYVSTNGTQGFTKVTAASGGRPGVRDIWVDVCQATTVNNYDMFMTDLGYDDCFAAFHPLGGYLPTTDFHADLYRVTLTAGQRLVLLTDPLDDGSLIITLADREGNVLKTSDEPGALFSYTAVNDGIYVFEVSSSPVDQHSVYWLNVQIF